MSLDLTAISDEFLNQCGICDLGIGSPCTCPSRDYRPTMLNLVREVERLRQVAWTLHGAMIDQHENAAHWLDDTCEPCETAAREGDSEFACDRYKTWQAAYMEALGLEIGPKS